MCTGSNVEILDEIRYKWKWLNTFVIPALWGFLQMIDKTTDPCHSGMIALKLLRLKNDVINYLITVGLFFLLLFLHLLHYLNLDCDPHRSYCNFTFQEHCC